MNLFKLLYFGLLLSTLYSCSTFTNTNIHSQFYSVPVNSILTLNKPIEIKSNTARTFFQYGNIVYENNLNIYYPHCSITVDNLVNYDRTIQPTSFNIYKVIDNEEYAQLNILYASITPFAYNDGPSIIGQASYYYLRSKDAPEVRTLECIQWGDPYDVKYVSIFDIQSSLGSFLTLKLHTQNSRK